MKCLNLKVWVRSKDLSVEIYRNCMSLKDFAFRDQITRAGLSIPSNIAEGAERRSDKDTRHFFNVAKASCAELFTQIHIGMEIGYLQREKGDALILELKEISAMLGALIKRLNSESAQTTVDCRP